MTSSLELVLSWSRGFASLSHDQPPCPGLRSIDWYQTHPRCTAWIEEWGLQAADLGWDTLRLFGVHPTAGTLRGDYTGALLPLTKAVLDVNAEFIRFPVTRSFRLSPVKSPGVPIWDFGKSP
ncbi:hypothetical protein VQ02_22550 [Methylobacterium variabile]|jgi:hypothetical protein|uniref:Uncharacterized protein n=1 Tax=Methylobacterium variabile TaxID=298794 RepID=A0A0J6V228_9HYPH|nr:hypothetical protein [Methylobacterium variabile]KMO32871.1 hypothetical protein VQ02_22550 [Methylobacterium variabile]